LVRTLAALVILSLSLAGCAQVTTYEKEVRVGKYQVAISLDPKTLNPPQLGSIGYSFVDTTDNKPVTKFQPISGALLHNVLVSRDLLTFWHSHADDVTDNTVSVPAYFPSRNKYYDFAIFKPLGAEQQVLTTTIEAGVAAGEPPELIPETSPVKTVGWLTFTFVHGTGEIKKGQPTQLVFTLREHGYPVTALWPLFGSAGHLWVVGSDGDNFGHEVAASEAHNYAATPGPGETQTPTAVSAGPVETSVPTQTLPPSPTFVPQIAAALRTTTAATPEAAPAVQRTAQSSVLTTPEVLPGVGYGPNLAFTHTFPRAGLYKCWVEVLYRGQVVTASYVVRVVE
jgi:hypothetical protein